MSIINLIKTSFYSLKRHKVRLFLTMIGIIIGISSVVTILSIGDGLKKQVNDSATTGSINKISVMFSPEEAGNNVSKFSEPFSDEDIEEMKKIDGVEKVEVQNGLGVSMLGDIAYANVEFFGNTRGILIGKYEDNKLKIAYGRNFSKDDSNVIILTYEDAEGLFENPGDAIGMAVNIMGQHYEVIGVQEKFAMDFSALMSLGTSSNYLLSEDFKNISSQEDMNSVASINVIVATSMDKKEVGDNVVKYLEETHSDLNGKYQVQDPDEITKAFSKIIDAITGFIAIVSGISLFVAGIGVMNIMYVSISERKREIGIRRAIGAYPSNILLQFLIEAVIVTAIGGILGLVFGVALAKIIGIFMPFKPVLTIRTVLISNITSVLTGIIFGVVPARKAANLPPIQAIYQ